MDKTLIITIPHYNNFNGLVKTIQSINEQFDIDIVITDDGSPEKLDETLIISSYKNNGNIFFQYLDGNYGVGIAANKCIEFVKKGTYKYMARLDAGDICYENKFIKQLRYLKNNDKIKLLGTWARVLNKNGDFLFNIKHPINHNEIKKKMFLNSMFVNPTIVLETSILETVPKYPEKYRNAAHDYAFFFKVIKDFKCANMPEVLLDYIIDENSISAKKRKLQVKNRIKIIIENFKFGPYPFYGLARSIILYFIPRSILTMIKSKMSK
jgi:hypothetical protein